MSDLWVPGEGEKCFVIHIDDRGAWVRKATRTGAFLSADLQSGPFQHPHCATMAAAGGIFKTYKEAFNRAEEINSRAKEALEPKPWKPAHGERFFWIFSGYLGLFKVIEDTANSTTASHFMPTNAFQTKQEADECLEELEQWFNDRAKRIAAQRLK